MKPSKFQHALVRVTKQSLCDFQRQLNPAERRHFAAKAAQAGEAQPRQHWLMGVRAWRRLSRSSPWAVEECLVCAVVVIPPEVQAPWDCPFMGITPQASETRD